MLKLISKVFFTLLKLFTVNNEPVTVVGEIKKILILRYGFLGDVLQATPFLRYLNEKYPGATMDFWVARKARAALDGNPRIHEVIDADMFGPLKTGRLLSIVKAGLYLKKCRYDMAVCLSSNPLSGFIAWIAGIPLRVGLITNVGKAVFLHRHIVVPLGDRMPRQKHYHDLVKLLGGDSCVPEEYPIELYWDKEDERYIDRLVGQTDGELIAIFPGGGENTMFRPWAERKWPAEKWVELGKRILAKYPQTHLLFFGAEGDTAMVNEIVGQLTRDMIVNVVGKTTFNQLGPLLKKCCLLVTNDTAPVFVASAVGCPVIVIYGPEWPERARPLGSRWAPVYVPVPCREQCAAFERPQACNGECLKGITADAVLAAANKILVFKGKK